MNENTNINPPYDYEIKQEEEIEKLEQDIENWKTLLAGLTYKHQDNVKRDIISKIQVLHTEVEQLKK